MSSEGWARNPADRDLLEDTNLRRLSSIRIGVTMPKRTNWFQKLVFLVKRHAAQGAVVTESKMLKDRITGTMREVDICIEGDVGGHEILIGVECNGRGRKASVTWIEEMKGKHERLPTSTLLLVARSGFSKEARRVAEASGVSLVTMRAIDDGVARRLFGSASSLWSRSFMLKPMKVVFVVEETPDLPREGVVVSQMNYVYSGDGSQVGMAKDVVDWLLRADFTVKELAERGESSHRSFLLEWTTPVEIQVYLQKLEPPVLRRIEQVRVAGECNFDISEFRLNHGRLGDVTVAWGTGSFFGKDALLVASGDPDKDTTMTISTD